MLAEDAPHIASGAAFAADPLTPLARGIEGLRIGVLQAPEVALQPALRAAALRKMAPFAALTRRPSRLCFRVCGCQWRFSYVLSSVDKLEGRACGRASVQCTCPPAPLQIPTWEPATPRPASRTA